MIIQEINEYISHLLKLNSIYRILYFKPIIELTVYGKKIEFIFCQISLLKKT
jgi:hypothetical protein